MLYQRPVVVIVATNATRQRTAGHTGAAPRCALSQLAITFERDLYGFTPGFWCELKSTYMNVYVSEKKHP